MKRSLEQGAHPDEAKTFKTINEEKKNVSEAGSDQQRRAAATKQVSPDALRFTPPQLRKPKP
jgi:hypothetical protein